MRATFEEELANTEGRKEAFRLALEIASVRSGNSYGLSSTNTNNIIIDAQKIYSYILNNEVPDPNNLTAID